MEYLVAHFRFYFSFNTANKNMLLWKLLEISSHRRRKKQSTLHLCHLIDIMITTAPIRRRSKQNRYAAVGIKIGKNLLCITQIIIYLNV